jgi:GrpE
VRPRERGGAEAAGAGAGTHRGVVSREVSGHARGCMQVGLVSWLRTLVGERRPAGALSAPQRAGTSPELSDVVEALRKSARATLRLDTRVDALEGQLDALGADVRSLLEHSRRGEDEFWVPLMDALDRLDLARDAIDAGEVAGAGAGLAAISSRLEELLASAGYARYARRGVPVDGRLQRVVGTASVADSPEGSVTRLVRAAVTRGEVVVRTGEVIVVKHFDSTESRHE